jgi:hypothetical protein
VCVSDVYMWSINPFTNPYPVYSHTPLNLNNIMILYGIFGGFFLHGTSTSFNCTDTQKKMQHHIMLYSEHDENKF